MDEQNVLGHHRGNISNIIPTVTSSPRDRKPQALTDYLFDCCGIEERPEKTSSLFMALDTPLGWPKGFRKLLQGELPSDWIYQASSKDLDNPLLYRRTERVLGSGFSVVAQSIGSQSTKGMALILALGAKHKTWGVWSIENVSLIETYPKACLLSNVFVEWMSSLDLDHDIREWANPIKINGEQNEPEFQPERVLVIQDDTFDAAVCCCLARAFASKELPLVNPPNAEAEEDQDEGWIFFPQGNLIQNSLADGHCSVTNALDTDSFGMAVREFQKHVLTPKIKKSAAAKILPKR